VNTRGVTTVINNTTHAKNSRVIAIAISGRPDADNNYSNNNIWYKISGDRWKWGTTSGSKLSDWKTYSRSNYDFNFDSIFVDIYTKDFSLQTVSPCIDAGVDVGLRKDYDRNSLPQGKTVDIGALEQKIISPPMHLRIINLAQINL